jgi:CO/xanthine dehydrogenase FAD-binding subunit
VRFPLWGDAHRRGLSRDQRTAGRFRLPRLRRKSRSMRMASASVSRWASAQWRLARCGSIRRRALRDARRGERGAEAVRAALADIEPLSTCMSADYRRRAAECLAVRAITDAYQRRGCACELN